MITPVVQRWRERRDLYRPAGETIRTAEYDVGLLRDEARAKAFVEAHHYSGSYPAARFRVGLFRRGELVGVAVFSVPARAACLDVLPGGRATGVELGRFVLLDDVPANGETWTLGRAFELLRREGVAGVVSFSDPEPRADAAGRRVFAGHIGTAYQAHNAVYLGRSKPGCVHLLPDGTLFHPRAAAKIRSGHQGRRYAAAVLERHGAAPLENGEDAGAWLDLWLPRLTRRVRHSGNHKYAWALEALGRRRMPASLRYPKFDPTPVSSAS